MVTNTSLDAFRNIVVREKTATQKDRIVEYLSYVSEPRTRRMISEATGLPINVVTARVNAMLPKGDDRGRVRVAYETPDPGTGFNAQWIELVGPKPQQRKLF